MKLYNYWRSSSSYRVRIALAHKQLSYEYVAVSLIKGEQHQAEHKARNPRSTVPLLDDGGVLVPESVAIFEYLEEKYPQRPLLPKELPARAQVRALAEVINSGIQPLHNLAVLKFVTDSLKGDQKQWAEHWIQTGLTALETMAARTAGTYLVGDAFTWADCCLVPQLFAARRFSTFDATRFPTLARVEQACLQLDAVKVSAPDRQPDAQPT